MNYYENVDDLFLDGEIFKDIDGYNGDYQVSNYGRIKSFKKYHGTDVRILKQIKNSDGYLRVNLYKNGKGKFIQIHDLMFESFNNYKLKKGEVIHHLNENPLYNDLDNFQLMTNSEHLSLHHSGENHHMFGKHHSEKTKQLMKENHADVSGKNNPMSGKNHSEKTKQSIRKNHPGVKLTEQKVIEIRESDLPQKELAKMFGVYPSTISKIKTGRTWKHI